MCHKFRKCYFACMRGCKIDSPFLKIKGGLIALWSDHHDEDGPGAADNR